MRFSISSLFNLFSVSNFALVSLKFFKSVEFLIYSCSIAFILACIVALSLYSLKNGDSIRIANLSSISFFYLLASCKSACKSTTLFYANSIDLTYPSNKWFFSFSSLKSIMISLCLLRSSSNYDLIPLKFDSNLLHLSCRVTN